MGVAVINDVKEVEMIAEAPHRTRIRNIAAQQSMSIVLASPFYVHQRLGHARQNLLCRDRIAFLAGEFGR